MIIGDEYLIDKLNSNKDKTEKNVTNEDLQDFIKDKEKSKNKLISSMNEFRMKISEQLRLNKICFLIGNGCSIYAGSKDTKSFNIINNTNKNYVKVNKIIDEIKELDLEKQLNRLLFLREYYHLVKKTGTEKYLESIYKNAKENLINNYVNSIDYNKLFFHEALLLKIRSCNCLNKLHIFSLNYDLALEYVMDNLLIEYSDGFTGFINRIFDPQNFLDNKPKVIKLHGSINWYEEGMHIKSVQPDFSKEDNRINLSIKNIEPLLIYPTLNKFYQTYNSPYSELMRYMLDSLKTGNNVLFIIGYKYGDEHINEIIKKSFVNPNNIYYFFDYDELSNNLLQENESINNSDSGNFLAYVKDISEKTSNINIIQGKNLASFEFFVDYIFPSMAEKTDEEKLVKILNDLRDKYDK